MKTTRSSRLLLAASTALALGTPSAALGLTVDCAQQGEGSAVAAPQECDEESQVESEVLGVVDERPDPQPAPDPEAAPEVLPETLTATGIDSGTLALGAFGALAMGGAALVASRRRSGSDA